MYAVSSYSEAFFEYVIKWINILLIVGTIVTSQPVWGQAEFQGKVMDTNYLPVSFASMSIYDSLDHILDVNSTNDKGYWKVKLPAKAIYIRFSCQGFSDTICLIRNLETTKINLLVLSRNSILLQDITIKAPRTGYKIHGDTITYNPLFFSTATDRYLGDILSKIPGFELSNGRIYYKGDIVQKLKVEGKDLFSDESDKYQNTISKAAMDKIQVIKDKSVDGITILSMNIGIKEEMRGKLLGSYNIETNLKNTSVNGSPYLTRGKFGARFSADNAKNILNASDRLPEYQDMERIITNLIRNNDLTDVQNPFFGTTGMGNQNNLFKSISSNFVYDLNSRLNLSLFSSVGAVDQGSLTNYQLFNILTKNTLGYQKKDYYYKSLVSIAPTLLYKSNVFQLELRYPFKHETFAAHSDYNFLNSISSVSNFNNTVRKEDLTPYGRFFINFKNNILLRGILDISKTGYMCELNGILDSTISSGLSDTIIQNIELSNCSLRGNIYLSKRIENLRISIYTQLFRKNTLFELNHHPNYYKFKTSTTELLSGIFAGYEDEKYTISLSLSAPFMERRQIQNYTNDNRHLFGKFNIGYKFHNGYKVFFNLNNQIGFNDLLQVDSSYYSTDLLVQRNGLIDYGNIFKNYTAAVGIISATVYKLQTALSIRYSRGYGTPIILSNFIDNKIYQSWYSADQTENFVMTGSLRYSLVERKMGINLKSRISVNNRHSSELYELKTLVSNHSIDVWINYIEEMPIKLAAEYNSYNVNYKSTSSINNGFSLRQEISLIINNFYSKANNNILFSKIGSDHQTRYITNIEIGYYLFKKKIGCYLKGSNIFEIKPKKNIDYNIQENNIGTLNYDSFGGYFQVGVSVLF